MSSAVDILLLMSDGAWTPLSLGLLQRTVMGAAMQYFTEIPEAILDLAGRAGSRRFGSCRGW
jgi:hypothetical protein